MSKYKIVLVLFSSFYLLYLTLNKLEDSTDRYKEIEKYIKFNLAGYLNYSPLNFYKRNYPEISIILSTFNGEIYLRPAVRSFYSKSIFF